MREALQDDLAALDESLLDAGERALRMLEGVIVLFEGWDATLAAGIADGGPGVGARYLAIERQVEQVIALHSPVASDLRHVLAALHINRHLERIAHNAVRIARSGEAPGPTDEVLDATLRRMSGLVVALVRDTLDVLRRRDTMGANNLRRRDDEVDDANSDLLNRVLRLSGDEGATVAAVHALHRARCLERAADHAVGIGEQVIYAATGEYRALNRSIT